MNSSEIFHGRYELLLRVGSGGFSEVWKALDMRSGIEVAIKIFRKQDQEGIQLCRDEFLKTYEFQHPNILTPFHFDVDDDRPYLIMKFITNGTLSAKLGQLNYSQINTLLNQLSSALHYLHTLPEPVIHGDIKPDNILIDEKGNFLLTDFGISTKLIQKFTQTMVADPFAESGKGVTPMAYRSPETFKYKNWTVGELTPKSDIWSAGVTLFQTIYDTLPFNGEGGLGQLIMMKSGHNDLKDILDLGDDKFSAFHNILLSALQLEPSMRPDVLNRQEEVVVTSSINHETKHSEALPFTENIATPIAKEKESKSWTYVLLLALIASGIIIGMTFYNKSQEGIILTENPNSEVVLIDDDTINHLSDSPTALNEEAQSPTVQESEVNRYKTSSNRELPIITPTNKDQKPTTGNISLNTSTVTIPTDQPKNNLASPSTPIINESAPVTSIQAVSNSEADKPTPTTSKTTSKLAIIKPNIPIPLALNEDVSNSDNYPAGSKIAFIVTRNIESYDQVFLQKDQVVYATVKKSNKNKISIRFPEVHSNGGTKLKSLNLDNFEINVGSDKKGKVFTPVTSAYQKNVQIQ